MKKFLVLAALAGVLVASVVGPAEAGRLVTKGISWKVANASTPGGHDFYYKYPIKVGATDTTATFNVQDWELPNAAFSDSVVIGWVCIGIDSSAAYSPTATSFTINIDTGNIGANELNMGTTGAVTFTDVTTTDRLVKIPIYKNFALARGVAGVADNFGPVMRMRIVAIGGVWSAATVSLMYWSNSAN